MDRRKFLLSLVSVPAIVVTGRFLTAEEKCSPGSIAPGRHPAQSIWEPTPEELDQIAKMLISDLPATHPRRSRDR